MSNQELAVIPFVAIILLAQSIYLFLDARKNGYHYWLWGLIGLIQAPMPLLFYLLFIKKILKKRR